MNREQIQEMAEQLRRPSGEKGIEVGKIMAESNLNMIKHGLSMLAPCNNEYILEIGYGNGSHLPLLFNHSDIRYSGLEISDAMYQEAVNANQDLIQNGKAEFLLYDGTHIPFPDRQFDKILSVNTLYFWPQPADFLRELGRVLAVGGVLAITFIEKCFLETLPFADLGFECYDRARIEAMINPDLFRIIDYKTEKDNVVSKMGEAVERVFSTVLLAKQSA